MGIVDCHVHLFPPEAAADPKKWAGERGEQRWATMVAPRPDGRRIQGWATADELIRDMDAAGIAKAVVQGWYWERHETCVAHNRFIRKCVSAHPGRLYASASFHPAGGDAALDDLKRARDAGFVGIGELCPEAQGYGHQDPAFESALAFAAECGWPVTFHVTDPAARDYPGRVATPLQTIVKFVGAHPEVRFILAHWGGLLPFFEINAGVARSLANASYDTAASPLIYRDGITEAVVSVIGTRKILFGSDYPILPRGAATPTFEPFLDVVRRAGVNDEARETILGGNARSLFRLD